MPEVEYNSWGSRLVKSVGGALLGIVMFFAAFGVLAWNEHKSVAVAKTLEEGAANCISVSSDKVDDANDGKLIHTTGAATTGETLTDDTFGVSDKALKQVRTVEIYQWVERSESKKQKKVGGGEATVTYYYHDKKWVNQPVSSDKFHEGEDGELPMNVGTLPYQNAEQKAKEVKLGAFKLQDKQWEKVLKFEPRPMTAAEYAALPADLKGKMKLREGVLYMPYKAPAEATKPDDAVKPVDKAAAPAGDSSEPQIGDVRIAFKVVKPQPVSVVSKQFKGSFEPWHSTAGGEDIDNLKPGTMSKEAMFTALEGENTTRTWLFRLLGLGLMAGGIFLVLNPFAVFADVLPFLGSLASVGIAIFALLIALPLTILTIAVSWIVVRPVLGVSLLVVGLIILGGAGYLVINRRKASALAKKAG